jgi:Ca-activated chloride channel family protein
MVVGPRYHPTHKHPTYINNKPDHTASALYETSVATETDTDSSKNNPVHIHILLDAGAPLRELDSSYHEIDIMQTSETRYSISTIGEQLYADRDFELVWQPELYERPRLSAFNEEVDGEHYTMLMLYPPAIDSLQDKLQARDVIFVLDISGSMSGTSIDQAKAALITALDALSPVDRFNIIWFNDETSSLFARTTPASEKYKRYAKLYVEQLQADGGTEMLPALQRALYKQEDFSRLRQVIFLTDGNISNETEMFDVIDRQLGNSRLFTIGIGSAPNSHFMQKAAQRGRGTFTYIGDIAEVQQKTTALFEKLETPALINLQLEIDSHRVSNDHIISDQHQYQLFPKNIPDLYAGEPLTLVLKGKDTPENITLRGDLNNTEWHTSVVLDTVTHDGIRIAWARNKIASLMDQHRTAHIESDRQAIQSDIMHTALKHQLVSRYTSLVAVDVTPTNTEGLLYQEKMKNNLPHGWTRNTQNKDVMLSQIRLPQTATSSSQNILFAIMLFIVALGLHLSNRHSVAGNRHV